MRMILHPGGTAPSEPPYMINKDVFWNWMTWPTAQEISQFLKWLCLQALACHVSETYRENLDLRENGKKPKTEANT